MAEDQGSSRTNKGYSFRIHVEMAPSDRLGFDQATIEWAVAGIPVRVKLTSGEPETSIKNSPHLIVRADEFPDEAAAQAAGTRLVHALQITLARLALGADFGGIRPSGGFYRYGLALLSRQRGRRVLNDVRGLMIFETEPSPLFASIGPARAIRTMHSVRFEHLFRAAVGVSDPPDDRTALAFELYNASFFESGVRSRFLLLVIAVEALIVQRKRPEGSCQHLEELIRLTNEDGSLGDADRVSLVGALASLQNHSIGYLGRELVASRLGDRSYDGLSAPDFFGKCYRLRGKLVHGQSAVTRDSVAQLVGQLERFVGDLLSFRILDVDV